MARFHYYEFPESVPANERAANGAYALTNFCTAAPERYATWNNPSKDCPYKDGFRGCFDCSKLECTEAEYVVHGISVTRAKKLLKIFGGHAYTRHVDRDGCCFEVTQIALGKNNSRHKYNRHL